MISTPAFANTIQLHNESHARRLFKARHHEVDKMQIHTHSLTESNCTIYLFQIRSAAHKPLHAAVVAGDDQSDSDDWLLTRRYSECAAFRNSMLRLVRQWEAQIENFAHKVHSREFELVSNSLRRPITPNFPRKHMRGDNATIVCERRRGLCAFVRKLLDAYADISVYLFNNPQILNDTGSGKYLREIHDALEAFLQVPESQKELERHRTAAVLALQDVHIDKASTCDKHGHPERTCCICLDDYECDTEPEPHFFFGDLEENQLEALARDKMVKLPCGHQFHEDCVIEWFNTSTTCPLCRTVVVPVGTPRALEVIM